MAEVCALRLRVLFLHIIVFYTGGSSAIIWATTPPSSLSLPLRPYCPFSFSFRRDRERREKFRERKRRGKGPKGPFPLPFLPRNPTLPSLSLPFSFYFSLPSPLNPARGSVERYKLPQRGPWRSPAVKAILIVFSPGNVPWWQQFCFFSCGQNVNLSQRNAVF